MDDQTLNLLPEDAKSQSKVIKPSRPDYYQDDLVTPAVLPEQKEEGTKKNDPSIFKRLFASNKKEKSSAVVKSGTQKQTIQEPSKAKASLFTEVGETIEEKHWWETEQVKPKKEVTVPVPPVEPILEPLKKREEPKTPTPPKVVSQPVVKKKPVTPKPEKTKTKKVVKPVPLPPVEEKNPDLGLDPHVNLVSEYVKTKKSPYFWSIGLLLFTLLCWGCVSGYAIYRNQQAEKEVALLHQRSTKADIALKNNAGAQKEATLLQKQIQMAQALVERHLYWTPFLKRLEETTIPDVYYTDLTVHKNGQVHISAIAKNYSAAARQIRAFQRASDFVQSVEVREASIGNQPGAALPVEVVTFDMEIFIKPEVLLQKSSQAL